MLDQLYYFSEVYRQRSISRAADFLHISRQALSHSIKTLENDLGVELFVREKDGVTPTNAAESLFKSSQVILDEEAVIRKICWLLRKMRQIFVGIVFARQCFM